eukprot:6206388-Pleurochrysis_carterae.AAC.3
MLSSAARFPEQLVVLVGLVLFVDVHSDGLRRREDLRVAPYLSRNGTRVENFVTSLAWWVEVEQL